MVAVAMLTRARSIGLEIVAERSAPHSPPASHPHPRTLTSPYVYLLAPHMLQHAYTKHLGRDPNGSTLVMSATPPLLMDRQQRWG